jgi:hypothetical protein
MRDDSTRWELRQQPPGWDPEEASRIHEAAKEARRQRHLAMLAERKADREAAKRLAKGLSAKPTDYPWLSDPGWIDRQRVRPFKGR